MKTKPLVTINIPTYNSAKTLAKTLESIIRQTYTNIEVIISDGGSGDETVAIAKKYKAEIQFIEKLGDARYRNYKKTKGKYLFSVDSDQILDPQVVAECVSLCEKGCDGVIIREQSLITKGTYLEHLIAYDKWLIDKNHADDPVFGTACPRFFRKSLFDRIQWPPGLSVFDDTILYAQLIKYGARIAYLSSSSIRHHEVTSWIMFAKKFFRYGKGYFEAFKEQPGTIAAHSLPRRSYFSAAALSKPHYFLGLLLLYGVKVVAAWLGTLSYFAGELQNILVNTGDGFYYTVLGWHLKDIKSILDVGCGSSSPLAKVRKHYYSVGVDAFGPSIEKSKKLGIHDAYKKGDVLAIDKLFRKKQFDAVIALDLIEHLEKKRGFELIKKMSGLAKKKIIIMTPNGFYKQEPYEGNKWQIHRSGWTVDDFLKLGFTLRGIRGLKWLRGEYATLKWKPWIFWGVVSVLSEPLVYFFPRLAYQLFAVKEIES